MSDEPKAPEAKAPRSRLRRFARRAGIALGALVLLVVLVVAWLHTSSGGGFLRARVEARLSSRLTTSATLGKLDFSLFSGVRLDDLAIMDRDGQKAIVIKRAFVKPSLGAIIGGTIALDEVAIDGVTVDVRSRPDGTTNLTGLAKPASPKTAEEQKKETHIVVGALAVRDLAIHLAKPDGLKVDVENASLEGNVDTRPTASTTQAALSLKVGRLAVQRPKLAILVTELTSKATADLTRGSGSVSLGPTVGAIHVARDEVKPVDTKLSLPRVSVDMTPERLTLAVETLELAALSIATAKVEASRKADGTFGRIESAQATKISVRAADVEALAGKRLLASDLTLQLAASGPEEAFSPELRITSAGGEIVARATLDLRDPKLLRYDASITTKQLDVNRIYASEKLPPLFVGALAVSAKGEHKEGAYPKAAGTLQLREVRVRDVMVDALDARAHVEDGVVTIDAFELRALGQKVDATGTYRTEGKDIDLSLVVDARVGELLGKLRSAGVLTAPPSPLLAALSLGRPAKVHLNGKLDGEMVVRVSDVDARVAGGSARATVVARVVRGDPEKGEKAVAVRHVEADLELQSVSLAEIGRLRGKPLPVAGRAHGRVRVHGDAEAPEGEVDLTVDLVSAEDKKESVGTLRVKGTATAARIDARATLTSASGKALATVEVKGARAGRGFGAPLHVALDVPDRPLADIAPLLRAELRDKLPKDARVAVHATLTGEGRSTRLEAAVTARLAADAPPITLQARAELAGPVSSATTAAATWTLDLEMPETDVATLPLPPERGADLHGKVALAVHARGTRDDVVGDVKLTTRALLRGASPPLDARIAITVAPDDTSVSVDGALAGVQVLEGKIRAALGGRGLLAAAKSGALAAANPVLDGQLRIPEHPMAEWSHIAPAARDLPGELGGSLDVAGTARDPELALRVGYAGYPTLAGRPGSLAVEARGRRERATVTVKANDTLTLIAELSPREILEARAKDGGEAKVHASLHGERVPLTSLLPDSERIRAMHPEGVVDARLTADASVVFHGETRELGSLSIKGPLSIVDGAFLIPTTRRRVHDVGLRIDGDGDKLAIRSIEAKESDRDEPSRTLAISGSYAVRERALTLLAKAHRVLVSGGTFGELDAPKAALTAEVEARAELGGPVRRIVVDVRALELDSPDRQPRAVQQEVLSLGDVIELGSGVAIGKLGAPAKAEAPNVEAPVLERGPPPGDKTLDVVVRLPNPVHVKQRPLDLHVKGEVHIERFGDRRVLSGKLEATGGSLLVGGRLHPLTRGEVRMGADGPFLDLHFKRPAHPAALRDMATSDGTDVHAHMVGVFGKQKISFSGAADGLFEALALENIGRVRVLSTPDAPAAQTPQLPLVPQIRQTAFMSANLPHLAFLDRMNTFADPNVSRFAYGRFENLEAERYSLDGTRRIRTTVRPPVIGQSDAEVEGSLLFVNSARVVSGVGILGGTRIGGGPTIFLEWSSAD